MSAAESDHRSAVSQGTARLAQAAAKVVPASVAPSRLDRSQRPDEHLLSGDTATKVRQAALARYPGAAVLVASDHPSSLAGPG